MYKSQIKCPFNYQRLYTWSLKNDKEMLNFVTAFFVHVLNIWQTEFEVLIPPFLALYLRI